MTLSGIGFMAMSICVKLTSGEVPEYQLVFFRAFINLVITSAFLFFWDSQLDVKKSFHLLIKAPMKQVLFLRGLFGFLGMSCLFYSLTVLPLSVGSFLSWCSPLFVFLIARLFLKEVVSKESFLWIVVAIGGLVIIFIAGPQSENLSRLGLLVGLLGAFFAGAAYTSVRAAAKKVSNNVIIFYLSLVSLVFSFPLAVFTWRPLSLSLWLLCLGTGLGATLGQYGMTQAYKNQKAALVSAMSLQGALFTVLSGFIFFNEKVYLAKVIGLTLTALAIVAMTLRSYTKGVR